MSLNKKALAVSFLFLIVALTAGFFYYKETRECRLPVPREEINITIIPGWNLRQIADDWVKKGIVKNSDEFYFYLGRPAYDYARFGEKSPTTTLESDPDFSYLFKDKPSAVSFEGYLFPDTYRIYADASVEEIILKIFDNLNKKITPEIRAEISRQDKSFFEILIMASLLEKEANTQKDMAAVSDIFWRRLKKNWALQSCASVNYITGKNDPGVSAKDKAIDSFFNTYEYTGLPLGPIGNPGMDAIKAAVYPQKNDFWYFMTGDDGKMRYAKTLEEHTRNVNKYLK
ncbi:MAG: endolytic transglycosylase MltG [Patescibacteria group bacterium]